MSITPPMPYSGGKQRIAAQIVATFPPHSHYVEPFAGALSVLLAKPRSRIETVNDLDGDLVTFWRCLRVRPDDLARACALTPYSRAEFQAASDREDCDDLERARRTWVAITQGRGARATSQGWKFTHGANQVGMPQYLTGYLQRFGPCVERLAGVSIENREASRLIEIYDDPEMLFYLDPPCLGETRRGTQYSHELTTQAEHQALLEQILACRSAVAISGYAHPLYDDALSGWQRHEFAARSMRGDPRTEILWTNYAADEHLFDVAGAVA